MSICLLLLLSSSLTTTTTFPCLCCVQQPKQCSELAVLPDKCLELICKSCFKLWSPHGFRILTFGKNGTLVSLLASRKAQKGRKFFVVLLMSARYPLPLATPQLSGVISAHHLISLWLCKQSLILHIDLIQ